MTARSQATLLEFLPVIYQDDPFLGQFLRAFSDILLGQSSTSLADEQSSEKGLAETIDHLADLFDPIKLAAGEVFPDDVEKNQAFLYWLSDWTAFSLRADLNLQQQGAFIARILPLYRRRGTKENLKQLLEIFTVAKPIIEEARSNDPSHFFRVIIPLPQLTPSALLRQLEIARSLIDLEKPAHTNYSLKPDFAGLQIGSQSTVGVDTILGTRTELSPET
jgi:P2-related tail formation protein